MQQIPLEFSFITSKGREDFLVSEANSDAVYWIDKWPEWSGSCLLLTGPKGCGKTHLAHIWSDRSNSRFLKASQLSAMTISGMTAISRENLILEDVDSTVDETGLLHLYNLMKENNQFLLMTSRQTIEQWSVKLPDLKSRLGTVQVARIKEPDDMLFGAILLKLFSDRQLQVTPEVVQYLLARLERTFQAALSVVQALDSLSLSEKRRITIPLVRDLLTQKS